MNVEDIEALILAAETRFEVMTGEDSVTCWERTDLGRIATLPDKPGLVRRLLLVRNSDAPGSALHDVYAAFEATGFEVRTVGMSTARRALSFILVNREFAAVGGGRSLSSSRANTRVEDRPTLDSLVAFYRQMWATATHAPAHELLYENAFAQQPVERESLLVGVQPAVWDELLDRLHRNPDDVFSLHPRKFEELIAHLLERKGLSVEITPVGGDGGKDVIVAAATEVGDFLYLVECKRYSPTTKVGVGLVRQLYGVVEHARATAGLLVTTSSFTSGALAYQQDLRTRLGLADYETVSRWIGNRRAPIF